MSFRAETGLVNIELKMFPELSMEMDFFPSFFKSLWELLPFFFFVKVHYNSRKEEK